MNTFMNTSIRTLLFLLATAIAFVSCENSTSSDEDEHSDPFGATLILNGIEVATQENGVISYNEGDHLELEVGEETNLMTIRWIDEDGDRFAPDENDGYSLGWIVSDENIVEVEQHSEDGAWSFHLVGLSTGEATIEFELFHNDHADFTTLPFEVHIEEVVSGMEIRDEAGESLIIISSDGTVTGEVNIQEGSTSDTYTAVFLDHEGLEIDTDHGYELEWHTEETGIATITGSDSNPFSFIISGDAAGNTSAHFELVKVEDDQDEGGDEHSHEGEIVIYESPDITINVN